VANWLKDRWQAAKNMNGHPIPGAHWLEIDIGEEITIYDGSGINSNANANTSRLLRFVIDWEDAYSNFWTIEVR
jgi:hypothetical protein